VLFRLWLMVAGKTKNPRPFCSRGLLSKLNLTTTSANGVVSYNDDDQCDDLYDVFQHCALNLAEFPIQSSPVFSQF